MWLLYSSTLEPKEFFGSSIPPYAILSHTWEYEEVSFADLHYRRSEIMKTTGYAKIRNCCEKAAADGYNWVWIDTCCIDKRNSAELSEAINSMFRWYERAQWCYAYLADVPGRYNGAAPGSDDLFLKSRWFTRGWTLQELIAPKRILFCAQDWTEIGTKETLALKINLCTGIPSSILLDSSNIEKASVAQRMSWASRRETTREEDMAYCLMGLFDVSMPMLYGEGIKSFERLQLEIIKTLHDQSVFAWKAEISSSDLLARSPADFADAGDIVAFNDPRFMWAYTMTHLGLSIRLPFLHPSNGPFAIAFLNCGYKTTAVDKQWIAIFLKRDDENFYHRVNCGEIILSHGPQDLKLNPRWRVRDHNYTVDDIRVFCRKSKKVVSETKEFADSIGHGAQRASSRSRSFPNQNTQDLFSPDSTGVPPLQDSELSTRGELSIYSPSEDPKDGRSKRTSRRRTGDASINLGHEPPPFDDLDTQAEKKGKLAKLLANDIPVGQQVKTVLFPRLFTITWLLIAVPVGIALNYVQVDPLAVYIINTIALIPLAIILSFVIEEIALRVGDVIGVLLNAIFGNAVVLIICIIAISRKEITIVQSFLVGSMLSNLLLTVGLSFFFGGITHLEQYFNATIAQFAGNLLALAVSGLIFPTAYTWGISYNPAESQGDERLSKGTAIILLAVYGTYLVFQLTSHKEMYNAPSQNVKNRKGVKEARGGMLNALASVNAFVRGRECQKTAEHTLIEDKTEPTLTIYGALVTLCAAIALISLCAKSLVRSVDQVLCRYPVSKNFVGLILLPIAGNMTELVTAGAVAIKGKMDLTVGIAIGSSIQLALLVIPFTVIFGWIIGADMTLLFDDFHVTILFATVILVNFLIADGKTHWLEGVILIYLYLIVCLSAWFYPQSHVSCTI